MLRCSPLTGRRWMKAVLLLLLFASALFKSGCSPDGLQLVSTHGETMGTWYNVKLVGERRSLPSESQLNRWSEDVFLAINESMSTYIASSELSRLNRSPGTDWHTVSAPLFEVVQISQQISQLTDGAFDITVAPLVNLWGFGPLERGQQVPDDALIAEALSLTGFRKLELDATRQALRRPPGMMLDLSAVAKGYAADELARVLMSKGFENILVEIGGELRLRGVNQRGTPWRIGIESPSYDVSAPADSPAKTVVLSDHGMATSGDYRNFYEVDGVRLSHTISPLTGTPVAHNLASVTVIADTCAQADALATAFSVMGDTEAFALAESRNIAAYFIVRDKDGFIARQTDAFSRLVGR